MDSTATVVVDTDVISFLFKNHSFAVLLPDTETARVWARIKTGCEKKGRPITFADAWIASAAVQLNVPLVTHNASDYGAVQNLKVLTAAKTLT